MIKCPFILLFSFFYLTHYAQLSFSDSLTATGNVQLQNKKRAMQKWIVPAIHVTAGSISLYALSKTWYAGYPTRSFYTVNDMDNWLLMDKWGHTWSAYTLSRLSAALWQQTGISHRQAIYRGSISAMSYQTLIELMDGFSSQWGFSWGDMGANFLGTMAYVTQESKLGKQVVHLKFMSYKRISYMPDIRNRANELYGDNFSSRLLNDYNAQTYWASINIKSVFPATKLPDWFNIAFGYGAGNMFGRTTNEWVDKNNIVVNRSDIPRYRRALISPDVDITKIKTNRKWLRALMFMVNAFKIPAPALEYTSQGRLKFHLMLLN